MKIPSPLFIVMLLAGLAVAREFRLDDGTVVQGELVSRTDSTVVIRNPWLGEFSLPRSRFVAGVDDSLASGSTPYLRDTDPAGYTLFVLPTAFMPPARAVTFRDFELFFLAFGFSPTATTAITTGFLFPIGDAQLLTLGLKQQLLEANGTAVAATGSVTMGSGADPLFNTNLVFSHRFASNGHKDAFGVHLAAGYVSAEGHGAGFFGGGAELRLGPHAKVISEYLSSNEYPESGLWNIGIRLHGESLSADIVAMRPLKADSDYLLFIPLVVVNYRF